MSENIEIKEMKEENQLLVEKIAQIILQNKTGMVREQDIRNFCQSDEQYNLIVQNIVKKFIQLGLSLIRTIFQGERYYVLTAKGKDEKISPTMYGALSLIAATYNEIGDQIPLNELKKMFKPVWGEIELLIEVNYLSEHEEDGLKNLVLTPLGKGALKNVLKGLDLKSIIF